MHHHEFITEICSHPRRLLLFNIYMYHQSEIALQQKGHLAEIQKLLVDFPDKVQYELESDKELARLQRKARYN